MSKNQPNTSSITRRTLMLGGLQLSTAGLIAWRMHQLGVIQGEKYLLLAEDNRINIRILPPARGLVYDRDGSLLTYNNRVYTIEIVAEQSGDPEKIINRLARLIPLSQNQIDKTLYEISKHRSFVPVTITTGLEWEHVAAISANSPALPGITLQLGLKRLYPKGADFAHVVGYVGSVNKRDLEKEENQGPLLKIPRFKIGKTGIEATMEIALRGKAGSKHIEVNSLGRVIRELDRDEGTPGINLQLTIAQKLQNYALERLKGASGSAVVMDVTNGDILSLTSSPAYDPNIFLKSISQKDWKILNDPQYRPLINKAVSGVYPPGSTFKMVVALAALKAGVVSPLDDVRCTGYTSIRNHRFHCWKRGGHGSLNLREALRHSCDVYFYEMSQRVGIERITAMAQHLGLGVRPVIELPSIKQGLTPTKEWKLKVKKSEWVLGDSMNAGIGQGFVLASPLQLAVMVSRIASGKKINPRLLNMQDNITLPNQEAEPLEISKKHLDLVRRGMFEVSNHPRGTAYAARIKSGHKIAGKTGTSQVKRITREERKRGIIKNKDLPWNRRDHALFVAFAPYENPKYAISVVIEHGGGGSKVAAPIARDIMKKALELNGEGYGSLPSYKREKL